MLRVPQVKALADALPERGVMLLENVRFHPEEEKNDDGFAARLMADTGLHHLRERCLRGCPPRPRLDRGRVTARPDEGWRGC
jgi:hypothetical protein